MYIKYFVYAIAAFLPLAVIAQPPGGRPGQPQGGPGPRNGHGDPAHWIKVLDSNQNERLEIEELQEAVGRTLAELDRNDNGAIEPGEAKLWRRPPGPPPEARQGAFDRPPEGGGKRLLPPFIFEEVFDAERTLSREEFARAVIEVFKRLDRNSDGAVDKKEGHMPIKGGPGSPGAGNPPPNARFIGAEMRFGDKLVKGQPFSAEIVINDTKRLFDGSTVTKSRSGSIYRDGDGRTRREQPMEMIAGVTVAGADNRPPMLIFINDFAARSHIFLDVNARVARRTPLGDLAGPHEPGQPENAKVQSLGTKMIDGVKVEGTRISFEIPAGQIGNDKPMEVITEKWFSPELQVTVMSRHVDPIAGEHLFKLVNIRRVEPSADLFSVPAGYRIEGAPGKRLIE